MRLDSWSDLAAVADPSGVPVKTRFVWTVTDNIAILTIAVPLCSYKLATSILTQLIDSVHIPKTAARLRLFIIIT